jgi:hypothetical protein
VHLFNLDPAAERFALPDGTAMTPSVDIKDLISLEEVMEDLGLGPNGGLVYCFECARVPELAVARAEKAD